jgi:hypothetical protein
MMDFTDPIIRGVSLFRMLNAGIPIAMVAKIARWSPAAIVSMVARYGHFSLSELGNGREHQRRRNSSGVLGISPGID